MDKLNNYRTIISKELCELANFTNKHISGRGFSVHAVIDTQRDQYLLVKTGWNRNRRVHGTTVYLRIVNEQIWIEEDWLEDGIGTRLARAGIPETDLMIASNSKEPVCLADTLTTAS